MSKKALWTAILLTAIAPMLWGSTYLVTTEFLPEGRPFIALFYVSFQRGYCCYFIPENGLKAPCGGS